jgi:hypothetical protein
MIEQLKGAAMLLSIAAPCFIEVTYSAVDHA